MFLIFTTHYPPETPPTTGFHHANFYLKKKTPKSDTDTRSKYSLPALQKKTAIISRT